MKEVSFVLWRRRPFPHVAYHGHRENCWKTTFSQVPQQSSCPSQTKKEFINANLFQANQMPLKKNILAQGTSVGLMTKRGTHSPGHSQRPLTAQGSRNPRWQPCSEAMGLTLKKERSTEIWFLFPLVESNNFRGICGALPWSISWDHRGCNQSHHASGSFFIIVLSQCEGKEKNILKPT